MYALILNSNSGMSYVVGTFNTKEEAEKHRQMNFPSRGLASWDVVCFLPAIKLAC